MDPGTRSRAELRMACLRRIGEAKLTRERRELLADFVDAYLPLTSDEEKEYKILDAGKQQEEKTVWMTWSERMRAEGERRALRGVLVRLLEKRFGPVPKKALKKVETLKSVPRLNDLVERVFTASSLEELGLPH
jgi:hypothetical protein